MSANASRVGSQGIEPQATEQNPSSKCATYLFAIAIIVGIGGLVIGGVGVAGYFQVGSLSHMAQIDAIIMMAAGGGGGLVLWIIGSVGAIKGCNTDSFEFFSGSLENTPRFGKAQWETYFGDVGDEPPLPHDIRTILNSRCPFWTDRKVKDTHMLVLIPETVNGEALTLDKLGNLIQNPRNQGHATKFNVYGDITSRAHGKKTGGSSHWVLMTKDVIPGSRKQSYKDQKKLVSQYAHRGYSVPSTLQAAVCILLEHVTSGNKIFQATTYTRCAEEVLRNPVIVGGFAYEGLEICWIADDNEFYGIAALRQF